MGDAIISLDEVIQFAYINNNEGNGGVFRHSLNPKGMFMDRPLHAYIHQFSRICALICEHCYTPIGSLTENINHLFKLYGYEIPKETILVIQERYESVETLNTFTCTKCDKVYCSKQCMEDAKDMHGLFCEIMTQEELGHWNDFHRYCLKSDENFYFVGRIYANILASSLVRPEKLQELIQELSTFYGEYNMEKPIIRSICDSSYHSDGPSGIEAFSLMMKALDRISKEITNKTPHFANIILKPGYFQTLLRKIQLVAVEIEIENPLNNKLKVIMQDPDVRRRLEKQITNLKRDLFGIRATSEEIKELDLELPDILGLGIYKCLSRLNHSCAPNLEVEYFGNNIARIRVLREVEEGVQATIAYVDENLPFNERQNYLLEKYNFVCRCTKCMEEVLHTI